jgi:hypothetical protein
MKRPKIAQTCNSGSDGLGHLHRFSCHNYWSGCNNSAETPLFIAKSDREGGYTVLTAITPFCLVTMLAPHTLPA